jgi:hypothetical protein
MWKSVVVTVILLAPAAWGAPTTRPSGAPKAKSMADRSERAERRFDSRAVDWNEAFQFFTQHSPLRAKAFEEMPEKQQEKLRPLIMERYASIRPTGKGDTALRTLREQQLETEDGIFGIKQSLDKPGVPAEAVERLKAKLRGKIKDLVESRMKERELRLARLETLLKKEREQLLADQEHKEQLLETRYQEVLNAKNPDAAAEHLRPFRPEGERAPGKNPGSGKNAPRK